MAGLETGGPLPHEVDPGHMVASLETGGPLQHAVDPGHLEAGLGVEEEEIREEVPEPVPAGIGVRCDSPHLKHVFLGLSNAKSTYTYLESEDRGWIRVVTKISRNEILRNFFRDFAKFSK